MLDPDRYALERAGRPVAIEPKSFDVLHYLIRHHERVATKQELLDAIWPSQVVSEWVLPRCIAAARKALDQRSSGAKFIATIHGRGYRFVAEVEKCEEGLAPDLAPLERSEEPCDPFVGREEVVRSVVLALDQATDGQGRTVLLGGEPGIGKTRTALEVARIASQRGARVFKGRCPETGGAPAFWPWIQILRGALRELPTSGLEAQLRSLPMDPALLLPELESSDVSATSGDYLHEKRRFLLFDAVTSALKAIASRGVTVLLLDDVHWGDLSSLHLLQYVAREIADQRILLLCTCRDLELGLQSPVSIVLGDLARVPGSQRLELEGLSEAECLELCEQMRGGAFSGERAAALARATHGNPFFLTELVRLEREEVEPRSSAQSAAISLPRSVRDAIARRLSDFHPRTTEILAAASILGRRLQLPVLEKLCERPAAEILAAFAEAARARILVEDAERLGGYRFAHALVRQTLYEQLPAHRRIELHGRAGAALESLYGMRDASRLPEIAHHFCEGAPGGNHKRALRFAVEAARYEASRTAHEAAAGYYRRAIQVLELQLPVDDATRCDLLLELALQLSLADDTEASRVHANDAAMLARGLGDAARLARAALVWYGPAFLGPIPMPEHRQRLQEAAVALRDDGPSDLRVMVGSRLTRTHPLELSPAQREAETRRLLELARETRDPEVVAEAIVARGMSLAGIDYEPQLDELVRVFDEVSKEYVCHPPLQRIMLQGKLRAQLQKGNVATAAGLNQELVDVGDQHGSFLLRWHPSVFAFGHALADGRFAEAQRIMNEAGELARSHQYAAGLELQSWQLVCLLYEQGELELLASFRKSAAGLYDFLGPLFKAFEVCVDALTGRGEEARANFERLARDDFDDLASNEATGYTLHSLTLACVAFGDRERSALLRRKLLPYSGRNIVHLEFLTYLGAADYYLAELASLEEDWKAATRYFESALEMNERIGARTAIAHTQEAWARMLRARGKRGDTEEARARCDRALELAGEIGMKAVALSAQITKSGL